MAGFNWSGTGYTQQENNYDEGLGMSMLSPEQRRFLETNKPTVPVVNTQTNNGNNNKTDLLNEQQGPSRTMANITAGGTLGLGLLSFLDNRKTAQLQREALRNDISTAKEHRANRQALGASWSKGWNS